MPEAPHQRLRRARQRAGYRTAAAFARDHGITEVTYRAHENGQNGFGVEDAKRYARLLGRGVTWQWLLGDDSARKAEMIGYVGAGEKIYPFDEGGFDPVTAPPGMDDPAAAVVRGKSMLPVYRDGDVLFFDRAETVTPAAIGRDCLVQVQDGPRYVKRLLRGAKRGTYRLFSYATLSESEDLRLEWARPVAWVMRG